MTPDLWQQINQLYHAALELAEWDRVNRGVHVELVPERGKGSHVTLYYGKRFTIVRNLKDELKTGTLQAMLSQLGLDKNDLA